jgi:hypothetical protein
MCMLSVVKGGGGSTSAQDTTKDLGQKLRTMIIDIYFYNFGAPETKLCTLPGGGGADGV